MFRSALVPLFFLTTLGLPACVTVEPATSEPSDTSTEPPWIALFNGEDLSGWTPKITGLALGEDPHEHFAVRAGLLQVRYEPNAAFDGRFGHLFFEGEFSHYNLLLEYRFVGEQCPGGPGWAWRNSGVMLHSQDPNTMRIDQAFPVSIEMQTLGSTSDRERPTANLCTPGTYVTWKGARHDTHCTESTSAPQPDDGWVQVRVEVRGHESIRHLVDGEVVLEYSQPMLDPGDQDAERLLHGGAPAALASGFLCLQSESHPVDFRRVDIQVLASPEPEHDRENSTAIRTGLPD